MSKIIGLNALIYIGGIAAEVPQRNSWSLNVTRELLEARVFSAVGAGSAWVEQEGGFRSWSGSVDGYYDDGDETLVDTIVGAGAGKKYMWLYEDRDTATNYWYGEAWFDIDQTVSVDGYAELSATFTGTGQIYRFAA